MAKETKETSKVYMCKSNKHTSKKVAKAEVGRIDYEQLIMDCFDCIFYGIFYCRSYGQFSLSDTNVLTRFMISLFPWLYFLQYLLQEYEEQEL